MLSPTEKALIRSFVRLILFCFDFVTLSSSLTTVRQSEKIFCSILTFVFFFSGRILRFLATLSKQFSAEGKRLKEDVLLFRKPTNLDLIDNDIIVRKKHCRRWKEIAEGKCCCSKKNKVNCVCLLLSRLFFL